MFSKKKKKLQISQPTNFEHRVHTGFDKREGRYVGLPLQWASIVGNNQILKSTNRPLPLVDPSEITPTEILDLKTIVRGDHKNENRLSVHQAKPNGIVLPKTSNVARSNSLRSSSPPRLRRGEIKSAANIPPVVPEEHLMQYPSVRRDQNPMKPPQQQQQQMLREQNSPALSNNEVIQHHQHNGNVQQHDQYNHNQYNQNNHRQISPAGSMASVPPMVMNHMNVHPHINAGPHHQAVPQQQQQQQQHNAFIHRPDHRPDQNQNIKNGTQSNHNHNQNHIHHQQQQQQQLPQPQQQIPQPQQQQQQHPNPNNTAASASKQQHEQRLTHEQVAQYQKKQYYVTIPRY